jgi:hypothetical protein
LSLSLAIVTKDSERYIERLLWAGRGFADEIVVAVDRTSTDRTEEICARYADRLFRIEPTRPSEARGIAFVEQALAWLNDQCTGDWILRLDDDELLSAGLIEALPRLMRDRQITHYWLRRRWIVGRNQAQWLADPPWWPDWQLRLFRNIPSIVRVPGQLHSSYVVQGEARYVYEGAIYHYDLVYHPLAQRQQKIERYDRLSPGNRVAFLYLVTDDLAPDDAADSILSIPTEDPPFHPSAERDSGSEPQAHRKLRPKSVSLSDVRRARLWRSDVEAFEDDPEIFRAELSAINCPIEMTAGETYWVDAWVRNESPLIWPSPGIGIPDVIVTYHWLQSSGEPYDFLGLQTHLPHTLRPGEATQIPVLVRAPVVPGSYVLQWDLLIEQVAWFSERGWQSPRSSIRVLDDASSALQRSVRAVYEKSIGRDQSAEPARREDSGGRESPT